MIEVQQVTKRYQKVVANRDISFRIPDGTTAILAGPNGAGKSTILKCIMGLLRYDGQIRINGHPNKSAEAKRLSGFVPEVPQLYPLLTVHEHMELVARLYRVPNWQSRAEALLRRYELLDKQDKLGSDLSKGMQQKVSICTALLPDPEILLFDEPLVGLDPHAIRQLKHNLGELRERGRSLIISTHILDSVDDIWDVVLIMMNGEFVAEVTEASLAADGRSLESVFFDITEQDGTRAEHLPDASDGETGEEEPR